VDLFSMVFVFSCGIVLPFLFLGLLIYAMLLLCNIQVIRIIANQRLTK